LPVDVKIVVEIIEGSSQSILRRDSNFLFFPSLLPATSWSLPLEAS